MCQQPAGDILLSFHHEKGKKFKDMTGKLKCKMNTIFPNFKKKRPGKKILALSSNNKKYVFYRQLPCAAACKMAAHGHLDANLKIQPNLGPVARDQMSNRIRCGEKCKILVLATFIFVRPNGHVDKTE